MSSPKTLVTGLMICLGSAGIILSTPAGAQQPREELVVTGSRIARADLTAVSPIIVVDSAQLEAKNITNVEEFLRQLPQFAAGIGQNTNNGNDGSSTIDLRNMGEERTLVLVNGKRFVPFDSQGYVDVAMIPASLIDHVEIITGGASAVYGADAIAGVVNFIMKNDFEGAQINGSFGITEEGDTERYAFDVTLGGAFDNGRGHIVFNTGYVKQNSLAQDQRSFGVTALDDLLDEVGSFTTPGGTVFDSSFPGDPEGGLVQFDANGNTVPFANTFNFNPFNLYVAPQQKWTATTLARYELTDNVEMFARMSFANNKVDTIIAPSGTFFEEIPLNYTVNPFLGQDARDRFALVDANDTNPNDGIVDNLLGRRLVEVGTRNSFYENTTYQIVGGFTGDVFNAQTWEVFGQWGRTNRSQVFQNDTSLSRAKQAAMAIADPNGGPDPVCALPDGSVNPNAACVPANFYGGEMSEAAADFLRLDLNEVTKTSQMIFGASLTGDIPLTIPTASLPLAYAAGVEYREEKSQSLPDAVYAAGEAIGFGASSPQNASIEVAEIFVEGQIPLLNDVFLAHSLMVDFGARYGDYSNKVLAIENDYDNTSWKIGGEWAPIESVRFRTSYQEAVRAPSLEEIGLPRTPSTGDLNSDPCENGALGQGDPALAALEALCVATGVPPNQLGNTVSIIAGQINNFIGGNPNLEPEDAETITVGLVWTPELLDNFSMTLDYYSIDITNVIVQISEQNTVDTCFNIERNAAGEFCSKLFRNDTNGGLVGPKAFGVDVTQVNAAFRKQSGIDFTFDIGFEIGNAGNLDFGFDSTYILEDKRQDASFTQEFDCTGLVGGTCLRPAPEFGFFQTTTWSMGPFMAQLSWQFIGELEQDAISLSGADPADFALAKIDDQNYFDLVGSWALGDTWTLRAGINNLLDDDPPIPGNDYGGTAENSGNTFPATYSPIGRNYFFGVSAKL